MYVGWIVEMSPTDELFLAPKHPYTAAFYFQPSRLLIPEFAQKCNPWKVMCPVRLTLAVVISIPDALLLLIYVGYRHQTWKKFDLITSWPVIGKPSYHCLESQSQPDPIRNMLFSADQKPH